MLHPSLTTSKTECQIPLNVRFVTTSISELGSALAGVSQRKGVTLVKKEHRSLSGFSGRDFRTIAGGAHSFLPEESKHKESSGVSWDAESLNNILHNYWSRKEMPVCLHHFLLQKKRS